MKKITLALVLVLALSGCDFGNKDEDANMNPGETANTQELSASDQALDQQLFSDALDSNNPSNCADIKDQKVKTECNGVLKSLDIARVAGETQDKGLCKSIEMERYQEYCENLVSNAMASQAETTRYEDLLEQKLSVIAKAVETKNPDKCKEITGSKNYEQECIYTVITSVEYNASSSAVCSKLEDETFKKACLDSPKFN